jgi:uncharacterized protein (UPF0147 family)
LVGTANLRDYSLPTGIKKAAEAAISKQTKHNDDLEIEALHSVHDVDSSPAKDAVAGGVV